METFDGNRMVKAGYCLEFLNNYIAPVVVVFGIVGNILSIIVLRNRRMRSPVSVYLLSLAVFDSLLLFSAGGLFLEPILTSGPCAHNSSLCLTSTPITYPWNQTGWFTSVYKMAIAHLFYPLGLTAQMATIWITVCLTAERFVAGCYPLHAGVLSSIPRARIAIVCCVIFSVIYNCPRWFELSYFVLEKDCHEVSSAHCIWHSMLRVIYYTWGYILFMFLLPVLALTVMNIKLIQALRRSDIFRNEYRAPCHCPNTYRGSHCQQLTTMNWNVTKSTPIVKSTWRVRLCCRTRDSTIQTHDHRLPVTLGVNASRALHVSDRWSLEHIALHSLPARTIPRVSPSGPYIRPDKNVTRMVIVVVGVFIACQLPAMVFNIYFGIVSTPEPEGGWCTLSAIRNFLVVVNSSINFVVYCCMGAKFRRSFVHVITPCLEKRSESSVVSNRTNRMYDVNCENSDWETRLQTPIRGYLSIS
ncbi:hypothetical protein P879_10930 [Paragonimus westermani]|uniref:G-protein coupled receptors family 1 profile domain-containing protein n=1 Tax=Paragonimus westermani TaxID=34504 RepID=A0A8T0D0M7_9TREM|nr:hypothetical protein P879_10930 [Paragonimus westermani]